MKTFCVTISGQAILWPAMSLQSHDANVHKDAEWNGRSVGYREIRHLSAERYKFRANAFYLDSCDLYFTHLFLVLVLYDIKEVLLFWKSLRKCANVVKRRPTAKMANFTMFSPLNRWWQHVFYDNIYFIMILI